MIKKYCGGEGILRFKSLSFKSSGFLMFSGVEKGCTESEWVNKTLFAQYKNIIISAFVAFNIMSNSKASR